MKENKIEKLVLKYISYNNINFLTKKGSKNFKTLFFILNLAKKNNNLLNIKFYRGRRYTKVYTVVKGPKCHKVGKHILKYNYYTYYISITRKIKFNKNLKNIEKYFFYLLNFFNIYNTNICSVYKNSLTTHVNLLK